jgi:hypothetical protein
MHQQSHLQVTNSSSSSSSSEKQQQLSTCRQG